MAEELSARVLNGTLTIKMVRGLEKECIVTGMTVTPGISLEYCHQHCAVN